MALSNGPNLGLLVDGVIGEEHYSALMAQWRGFDVLIQCSVFSRSVSAPPGGPSDGAAYIIGASASGAWAGHENKIARWSSKESAWQIITPKNGWRAYVDSDALVYTYISAVWYQREAPIRAAVNNQAGTSYTFVPADAMGRVTRFTSNTAVSATLPLNAAQPILDNSVLTLRQVGDGQVTIVPQLGVTLNVPNGLYAKTARKGSVLMLHQVSPDTWDLTGDLSIT